jgi:hypothetical protein
MTVDPHYLSFCRALLGFMPLCLLSACSGLGLVAAESAISGVADFPYHTPQVTLDGLDLLEPAHYSFGAAAMADGAVLFTEFNRQKLVKWMPGSGAVELVRSRLGGMYGVTADTLGNIYVGLDLGDVGYPAKVLQIDREGNERYIIENIKRPRQLASDAAGNVYVATESPGQILKWDAATEVVSVLVDGLNAAQGVAVGEDGSVFFSEYGVFRQDENGSVMPHAAGRVGVCRPDGQIVTLAEGFWRARGIAYMGGALYLACESDYYDHGNAGSIVRIDPRTGAAETLLQGIDYPEFPTAGADGKLYFTLGRDNWLCSYDPDVKVTAGDWCDDDAIQLSMVGGSWSPNQSGIPFSLQVEDLLLDGRLVPMGRYEAVSGWVRVAADRFDLSRDELYTDRGDPEHPAPGIFELPEVVCEAREGRCRVAVLPVREQVKARWPMTSVGSDGEAAAPGFGESPLAYWVYFEWKPRQR